MSISPEQRERFDQEALPHLEAVYRFAQRITANQKHLAEDLVQECFEKALRAFHQFRPGTNCKSWLFTILANCHKMRLRSAQNRRENLTREDEEGDTGFFERHQGEELGHRDNPEAILLKNLPSREMKEALDALSPPLRTALLLCDVEQLSYQEIADILGLPLGTVRSRISRARDNLTQRLKKILAKPAEGR